MYREAPEPRMDMGLKKGGAAVPDWSSFQEKERKEPEMREVADVMRRKMAMFNAQAAKGLLGWKIPYLFVGLMLAGICVIAAPAHAADTAICTVSHPLTLSPGLTLTPGQHEYTNNSIGTINCLGSLNGRQIVGPGSVTNEGHLTGTCAQGTGSGEFQFLIPIAGGTEFPVVEKYTSHYVGIVGTISGPVFSGAFEFLPQSGDCLLTPLTQVAVLAQGTITS
jgi:hypothetical protein